MEEAPPSAEGGKTKSKVTLRSLSKELRRVTYLAAPMLVGSVSRYLLPVVSLMMAGHLDKLSLSGVAIGNAFTTVTGFSLVFGMSCAMETLCGQAFGAEQYQKLGIYIYCSIISVTLVCFPIPLLWMFEEKLLILLGQDPSVSKIAGKYSILLIPALLAYAILQSLVRYLQTQGLTLAMLLSSFAILCFHIPVCWALVYKLELGITGAALSVGLSHWLNVTWLVIYIKYSSACERTRATFSLEVFRSIREFFQFGIPAAVMACFESWAIEIMILLSGFLRNSKFETSVLSICITTTSLHYVISYGIASAASTRVSNELGAGNPEAAKVAVTASMILAAIEAISTSIILFCCRSVLGYVYSNDKEVVKYVAHITPLVSLSVIIDSLRATLSGIARGSGWQRLGAYVNLVAFYLVGIPLAVVLCFVLHFRGVGLWIGILAGSTTQLLLFLLKISFTSWKKQATKARERIFAQTRADGNRGLT
ncbi:Multi antimicrobial extrusion protein [Trema orientale]|uniref:Protein DETOXIFICATION n=1 Tax=Trema orientale TaxID=63057 RepID=A0A2P5BNB4_TREOI|nr:Multi antimicrobial extrusion protein [Trema orientale]